jgi:WD40 repeat protein
MKLERSRRHVWLGFLVAGVLAATAIPASAAGGTRLWASRFDSAAHHEDEPSSLAVSPDGSSVYVTGTSRRWPNRTFTTLAYDAVSGGTLWMQTYRGPGFDALANDIALSPDGSIVIVAGTTESSGTGTDVAVVAYDASTGASLWSRRYDESSTDLAFSIATDPKTPMFFVTGWASAPAGSAQVLTIAYDYDAEHASKRWVRHYDGSAIGDDAAYRVEVSPDGSGVFVSGDGYGGTEHRFDYLTIGYDAATGNRRWVRRYDGWAHGDEESRALSVGSDAVFVTGASPRADGTDDYATVAYDPATGAKRWVARYDGPGHWYDLASGVQVAPGTGWVFVTGQSLGATGDYDYATVAYDAGTGAQLWVSRFDAGSNDLASSIAVSPDGSAVFVTGDSFADATLSDFATVAYDASTGAERWAKRYDGPASYYDVPTAIGVSASAVFVTGRSWDAAQIDDYATVAYAAA